MAFYPVGEVTVYMNGEKVGVVKPDEPEIARDTQLMGEIADLARKLADYWHECDNDDDREWEELCERVEGLDQRAGDAYGELNKRVAKLEVWADRMVDVANGELDALEKLARSLFRWNLVLSGGLAGTVVAFVIYAVTH